MIEVKEFGNCRAPLFVAKILFWLRLEKESSRIKNVIGLGGKEEELE